jgi:prepilin peptidase CpaA
MSPELVKTIVLGLFAALVIGAAVRDLASFTIPNWISIALAAAFAPAALLVGVPLPEIGVGLAVGAGMLVVGAGMFALGWIGGGDAKLMAAAALWVGLRGLAPFAIYTALAGGLLALALVALRSAWLRPLAAAGPGWTQRLATPGEAAPYGVAIAVGALAAFAAHPLA